MATRAELKDMCSQVRRDILRMVNQFSSGHPGGSLGAVEYFVGLYGEVMKHRSDFSMDGKGEDLFFLSNGHISPVYYSTLARNGYFDVAELKTFRALNSRLQGHPTTHEGLPGIRVSTGSLGQGISVAVGAALRKKMDGEKEFVYCLTGDGELNEGQVWEAAMFAAHNNLDNLIVSVDYNQIQIDGRTEEVSFEHDLPGKWNAFGWNVVEVSNGNNLDNVIDALKAAKENTGSGKPTVLILHTIMGKGVDFMEDDGGWHGVAPTNDQLAIALKQLPETLGDY